VGAQAGARELAANVYELDPGAVGSPLHVHHQPPDVVEYPDTGATLVVLAEQRLAYPQK
jgi:hypothetical protein